MKQALAALEAYGLGFFVFLYKKRIPDLEVKVTLGVPNFDFRKITITNKQCQKSSRSSFSSLRLRFFSIKNSVFSLNIVAPQGIGNI